MDSGGNGGVNGGIDLPGLSATIECRAYGFGLNESVATLADAGRGDGHFTPSIPLNTTAGLIIMAKVRPDGWPAQAKFNGITTSLTLTLDQTRDADGNVIAAIKATCQILIVGAKINSSEGPKHEAVGPKGDTLWDLEIKATLAAEPVYTGWGLDVDGVPHSQPLTVQPSYADKVRYEGLQKTRDKWNLADDSVNELRVWGIADNDQAEFDKLATLITSLTVSLLGLKLRTVQLVQRMSSMVCVIRCTWARRDTRDDAIQPDYLLHTDVDNVTNRGTASELNALPANPNLPFTVLSGLDVRRLDDGTLKFTAAYEGWNPKQAKELGGTFVIDDPTGIGKSGRTVKVFTTVDGPPALNSFAVPAGLKPSGFRADSISAFQSTYTVTFDITDGAEKLIFPQTPTETDASNLRSTKATGQFFTTGSEPSIPAAPSGLVYRQKRVLQVVSTDTSAPQSVVFWQYGTTTNGDDVTFPRTSNAVDPNDIETVQAVASLVTTGSTPPSAGAILGRLKLDKSEDIPLTNAGASNLSLRITTYAKLDSIDRIENPKFKTHVDTDGSVSLSIDDLAIRTKRWTTDTSPPGAPDNPPGNNVKLLGSDDLLVTRAINGFPGTMERIFVYGARSSADERLLENTSTEIDASGIRSTAVRACLDGDSIIDPDPTIFVPRTTKTVPLTRGLLINRTLTIKVYGTVTIAQEMQNAETTALANPIDIFKSRTATLVPTTGTAITMATGFDAALRVSDSTYRGTEVRILNSKQAMQVIDRTGEDKKIIPAGGSVIEDSVRGIPTGALGLDTFPTGVFGNTAAYVKVKVLGRSAGGLGFLDIVPTFIRRARGRFRYRRVFLDTDPTSHFRLNIQKNVNNSAFLGFPQYSVTYSHPEVTYTRAYGTVRPYFIDYVFETDDAMFMIDGDLIIGRMDNFPLTPLAASGFFPATIFDATALLRWPVSTDFGVFTA